MVNDDSNKRITLRRTRDEHARKAAVNSGSRIALWEWCRECAGWILFHAAWAGKILTGDEGAFDDEGNLKPLIYAIDTNGVVSSFSLGIAPEDFDIIQTNQDYYACDVGGENASNGLIVKLSRTLFADYVGDLLITDAAEFRPPDLPLTEPFRSKAFIVSWDGTNFVTRKIDYTLPDEVLGTHLEHATFAPINLPNLIP